MAAIDDVRTDRQMVASGALVPMDDPRAGAPLTVASPVWLEGVDKVAPRLAPDLGARSCAKRATGSRRSRPCLPLVRGPGEVAPPTRTAADRFPTRDRRLHGDHSRVRGSDGQSHFEEIHPSFTSRGDQSESAELIPGSGIIIRRFEPTRANPWHHAPGRAAVFTLSGAVDIEIGDGTVRRLGPGDILIAEDLTGQGHGTREVGPEPRVSIFVPLRE